jgi:hypothetical protein
MKRFGPSRRRSFKRINGSKNLRSPPQKDFCNKIGTKRTFAGLASYGEALSRLSSDLNAIDFLSINCERFADWTLRAETCAPASINDFSREKMGWKRDSFVSENGWFGTSVVH